MAAGICLRHCLPSTGSLSKESLDRLTLQDGFEGRPGRKPCLSVDKKTDGGCNFEDRGHAMG
jgi:hypothetical protein